MAVGKRVLENGYLRVAFDERGEIASIHDKEADRELAAGPCNALRLYKDVPAGWDAWDLDSMYELTPVPLEGRATVEVVDAGPLVARAAYTAQAERVATSSRWSACGAEADGSTSPPPSSGGRATSCSRWSSRSSTGPTMPCTRSSSATCAARRTARASSTQTGSRCRNHQWTAIVEENRGFAVLNDGKYGVSVLGSTIALSLLKSPLAPDMRADKGTQCFTYAFSAWNGSLAASGLVHEGYDLNVPVKTAEGGSGSRSMVTVDAPGSCSRP